MNNIDELINILWKDYDVTIAPGNNHPYKGWSFKKEYQKELLHKKMNEFAELIIKEYKND